MSRSMYLARWGVFIGTDNPIDAAEQAQQAVQASGHTFWTVTDLDTRDTFVVDLGNKRIVEPECKKTR